MREIIKRWSIPAVACENRGLHRSDVFAGECGLFFGRLCQSASGRSVECRRQRFANEFTEIQDLAAFRNVREQNFDKGMLSVEGGALPVLRAHNPLNRCKVQLAKRI